MTGSLQIKNGKFYMVLNTTDLNGKRKPKWIATGYDAKGNKKRAELMLRETLREYEQRHGKPQANMPFADWVRQWLEDVEKRVDAVTYAQYRNTAWLHVIPYFETRGLRLDEITHEILQNFMDEKRGNGRMDGKGALSTVSLRHFRNILNQSLKAAVRGGLIPSNPCEGVILPKKEQREVNFYTSEQLSELLQAVRNDPLYPLLRVVTVYGLRRSELLGLQWDSVDFTQNTLTIKHMVVKHDGLFEKDKTKNAASRRTFPLVPDIRELLLGLRSQEQENRRLFGREYHESPYIFKWASGKPLSPDYVSHRFSDLLEKHNLPHIHFHDLRHSCASLLIAQGFGLKDVQEWLGHADIAMTANIYAHLDIKRKQSIADSLAGSLAGAR